MYFVIDSMESSKIILYIGETNSANKRWKGEHDCKNYLMNYKEALSHNNLSSHQDIRFFLDVPKEDRSIFFNAIELIISRSCFSTLSDLVYGLLDVNLIQAYALLL